MNEIIQIIGTTTQEILAKLTISAGVAVASKTDESGEEYYLVEVNGENLAILIGYHGETLYAMQQILMQIVAKKTGTWTRITIDIDGWQSQRRQHLEEMVDRIAQNVRTSGRAHSLPPMTPQERKIIHSSVSKHEDVESISEGIGSSRKVIIKLKPQQE